MPGNLRYSPCGIHSFKDPNRICNCVEKLIEKIKKEEIPPEEKISKTAKENGKKAWSHKNKTKLAG